MHRSGPSGLLPLVWDHAPPWKNRVGCAIRLPVMVDGPTGNDTEAVSLPRRGNLVATGYMLVAVGGFSVIPLVIGLGDGRENPLLFNAGWRFGVLLGCLSFLSFGNLPLLRDLEVWKLLWRRMFSWAMFFVIVGGFQFALFTWSTRFIDISVAAVLLETWPILLILLTGRLFRREGRFGGTSSNVFGFVVAGLVGFVFVTASHSADPELLSGFGGVSLIGLVPGVLFAVSAAGAGALEAAFNLRWGVDSSRELVSSARGVRDYQSLDLFFVVLALAVASAVSFPIHAAAGLIGGETITGWSLAIAVLGGGFVQALSSIVYRMAALKTSNLGINALGYAIPVLSLIWLAISSQISVARVDYLVIGAAAIITANLLINFEAEIRWGFKALILALLTFGAFVYLRDGIFVHFGIDGWVWRGGGYFESITLSATVFTLLLAFRVTRLVSRTSEEDSRMFIVYRNLDLLSRRGIVDGEVCRHVLVIDRSRDLSLVRAAYREAREIIISVVPDSLGEVDSNLLSQAESNLDALVRSKQVDIHLGEMFALVVFGLVTVGLALFSHPPGVEGWTRLLADVFAMVVSSVIVFLLVHIQDLQRERDDPKLELVDPYGTEPLYRYYLVLFPDTAHRSFDQRLSVVIGVAIVFTYVVLLGYQWLA